MKMKTALLIAGSVMSLTMVGCCMRVQVGPPEPLMVDAEQYTTLAQENAKLQHERAQLIQYSKRCQDIINNDQKQLKDIQARLSMIQSLSKELVKEVSEAEDTNQVADILRKYGFKNDKKEEKTDAE